MDKNAAENKKDKLSINILLSRTFWIIMSIGTVFTIGLQVGKAQKDNDLDGLGSKLNEISRKVSIVNDFVITQNEKVDSLSSLNGDLAFLDEIYIDLTIKEAIHNKNHTEIETIIDFDQFIEVDQFKYRYFIEELVGKDRYKYIARGKDHILNNPNSITVIKSVVFPKLKKGIYRFTLEVESYKRFAEEFEISE